MMQAGDASVRNAAHAFLGGGATATQIGARDWSATPLGPIEAWPASLRTALGMVLANPLPMVLAWGAELTTFHNDAYRALLDDRPGALGRHFLDVWPEHRDRLHPLFERALAGEACRFEDAPFALSGQGERAEAFVDFALSPVRDEAGAVAGVLGIAVETTARVLAQRRQAAERERLEQMFEQAPGFMAMLHGPDHRFELVNPAYRKLIGHRDVIGRKIADALPDAVEQGYLALLDRVYATGKAVSSFGASYAVQATPGGAVDERFVDFVCQPVTGADGRISGVFVEGVDVTDRQHAEAALRESDARYRMLFDAIDAGFCVVEVIFDAAGCPVDYRFIEANPAFEVQTGLVDAVGRTARELVPDLEPRWFEIYGRVALTGEAARFEDGSEPMGRWFDVHALRVGTPAARRVAILFNDISDRKRIEERLRESEERFRRITDSAPVPIWVTRLDRKRGFVNRAYIEFLGVSYDEAIDFDWRQVIHPDDQQQLIAASVAGEASLQPFVLEGRYRRADGKWRWLRSESQPRWGPDGEHIGFIGVAHDVTDAKEAEAALRASEARLLLAQRGARAAAWEWDLTERTIRWADADLLKELAGDDVPQVVAEASWLSRIHPDDAQRRYQEGVDASEAGAGRTTYRILRDGEVRWLEAVGEVTERDRDGRPLKLSGITLDITDRKRAEEQLRESETRLRLAIDAAHMGIWEADLSTDTLKGSPQLNRLLGLPEDAPLDAEAIRSRYYPGERERVAAAGREALRHPDRFGEVEFRYAMPNGALRWLLLRAQAQVDASGTPTGFIGVMIDITDRKRAEEHQQLLINELNHRVKNTLAIVQGIAQQTFKGPDLPTEARQAFEGRLSALSAAHNLLTRQNWESASIRQIVGDAVAAVGPRADRVRIAGPDILLSPKTAVSLAMAVHELATNAVKYGSLSVPDGEVEVRWRTGEGRLHLVWRERGGPAVVPPTKRGFGTRMIERGLAGELGGEVGIEFRREGLTCTVDAPLPELSA
jgi:PAS domain S-box-containing protein